MLIVSDAEIAVREPGDVRVEGRLVRHRARVVDFLTHLGLAHAAIHHRFGRYVFSRNIDPPVRQRLRNFLINECPVT